jgi:glycerophosphoryl diester phosphodiesterase
MWDELNIPIVIAHRGDKAFAPENTLSAFKQAADKGADGIEFDVKRTADGTVIVIHDQTVDRTTNGTGKVTQMMLAELRELDAAKLFPGKFPGEKIPLLDEVFESVGQRVYMNVELTNYATPFDDLVPRVVELVRRHALQKRVFFSSFLPTNLEQARGLLPEVPRGQLCMRGRLGMWGRAFGWRGRMDALNPHFMDVDAGLVERVHARGKRLYAWPVYNEEDIKRMISLGVDGIITQDPALALRLLGRGK